MRKKILISGPLFISILLFSAACGKKGDPLPPIKHLPPPTYRVNIAQHGESAVITFNLPRQAKDGTPFTSEDFGKLEIYCLAEQDLGGEEREFEDVSVAETSGTQQKGGMAGMVGGGGGIKIIGAAGGGGMAGDVAGWESMEGQTGSGGPDDYRYRGTGTTDIFPRDVFERKSEKIFVIDKENVQEYLNGWKFSIPIELDGLTEENIYDKRLYFAIKLFNHKGQNDGFSNLVTLAPQVAPNSPTSLEAQVSQDAITLTWESPNAMADGSELPKNLGYLVFRTVEEKDFGTLPLNTRLLSSTEFQDRSFNFNKSYRYAVRAVIKTEKVSKESENGEEIFVRPEDTFPPSVPAGLNSVRGEGEITLIWTPNLDTDLDGYNVYRSTRPDGGFIKLNTLPLKKNAFSDTDISVDQKYYYRISAVDRADPPNESGFSDTISETLS